jgi:hypothetical protein
MLGSPPALANPFCDMMLQMSRPRYDAPDGVTCQTILLISGQYQRSCYRSYPYRSGDARAAFASIGFELADCLGAKAVQSVDRSVNHPDSYELHRYQLNGVEYAVSLKDKAALQQTLVFLRVPQQPQKR